MKANRHQKILELIAENDIDTQEELLRQLKVQGFHVTQATVSRDIKELRLVKTLCNDGHHYRYATGHREVPQDLSERFMSIFVESVKSVDCAGNMVVIRCLTGMANAACAAMDSIRYTGVVGTLAGDDTIFALMRSEERAQELVTELKNLIDASQR